MKTKLFLLMAIVLFACSTAKAYDAEIDGIYYNFNGDEAEVTNKRLGLYNSYSGDIVIPESVIYNEKTYSVTSIGSQAFFSCDSLTSVAIPNSVTYIGKEAFSRSKALSSVTIPNSVTSIGYGVFSGCSSLASVTIPNTVKSIGDYAFEGCDGLTSVSIPNSVTSIGHNAFNACDGLTSIAIGNSVTSIGAGAFSNCDVLTSVTIPNSVKSIGYEAFRRCTGLTSITIPSSVTSIESRAFDECSGLKKIIVPDIAAWCDIAFYHFSSNPLYYAGGHLYSDETTEITDLVIPNSVTSIGNYAFYNCDGLTSVTIPNSVTSIRSSAFNACDGLTSVTIPNSVTSIGEDAFYNCTGLKKVIVPDIAAWCGIAFGNGRANPLNFAKHLFSDETTEITNLIVPNSVTSIGDYAFYYCSGLTSVTIPNSVTNIGSNAFDGCSGLKKVIVPNIAAWCDIAFDNNYSNPLNYAKHLYSDETTEITNLIIPNSVKSIGDQAFRSCSGLASVTIANSVTNIGESAFYGCTELIDVYCYSESVPSTDSDAFTYSPTKNATLHVPYGCKAAYEAVSPWNKFGEIVEMTSPITIGETGFATFCSPHALDFSEVEDIRAYIVSGFNQETGTLVLTRVIEVPAGEGLYIAGMPGNHEIPQTKTSMFYANLLKGVTEPTIISPTDGNYTNYILSNGSYGVGFYTLSQTGTLDAGKAYLQLPTASVAGIKALKIEFDENDDPTGIAITSNTSAEENTIYNLAGQRVSKAQKGINIVNGKKVFIK